MNYKQQIEEDKMNQIMERNIEYLNQLTEQMKSGQVSVFAGAGVSVASGYVDWKNLLKPICKLLRLDINGDLTEIAQYYKNQYLVSMGYGYKLGIDLPGENRGFLPNSEYYDKYHGKRWSSSTVISIAIGQGEVLATPLQICNLAATIANRGYFITPHVVKEVQDTPLDSLYTDKRYTMVNRENYEIVAEGMRNAVIGGTCRGAAIPDIEVCGKTGTAENPHGKDHSAFIGFAPYRNPKVAICVYVENGGFGATYGVPIGKLMMEKYLKGEISEENKLLEETMSNAVVSPNVLSLPNREL